ncbi:MAG: glycosyltransferase [Halobacteriovoraceae bacterium]|jgi:glycosyltransferase involved in cell wall biosynthesis|nr:glycosyltransferase [Halobacteriovoraceae bacterium]MBT5093646.1 glycosyltransferase [Halobacteriovoraceae bacterium]
MLITIIIPTFNEIEKGFLATILENLKGLNDCEVICVDSQSNDGTCQLIEKHQAKLLTCLTDSRGDRLNQGIEQAKGEIIFLHHPRSIIDTKVFREIQNFKNPKVWGALTHSFDKNHYLLNFTSWYSNEVRGKINGIYYLDHCLFFHKDLLPRKNPIPKVPIFEDTLICQKLLQSGHPLLLPYTSKTSAIRFEKNGIWRQVVLNLLLKLAFHFNIDYQTMNRLYEKGLSLNSKY